MSFVTHFTRLYGVPHGSRWLFQQVLQIFSKLALSSDVHAVFPLSANYYDILLLVLGTGAP